MEMRVEDSGELRRVIVSGRMDSAGVDLLENRFNAATAARGKNTVVDLSEVTFIASMGIRMLVTAAQSLAGRGSKLILLKPTELVLSVLEGGMIHQIIPVVHSEQEASALLEA